MSETQQSFGTMQNANDMVKQDVTWLFCQAREAGVFFFRRLHRQDGNILAAYNDFITRFYDLFISVKYNIEATGKVDNWKQKMDELDKFFYIDAPKCKPTEYCPDIIIKFDNFIEVCRTAGIYNLSGTDFRRG